MEKDSDAKMLTRIFDKFLQKDASFLRCESREQKQPEEKGGKEMFRRVAGCLRRESVG